MLKTDPRKIYISKKTRAKAPAVDVVVKEEVLTPVKVEEAPGPSASGSSSSEIEKIAIEGGLTDDTINNFVESGLFDRKEVDFLTEGGPRDQKSALKDRFGADETDGAG